MKKLYNINITRDIYIYIYIHIYCVGSYARMIIHTFIICEHEHVLCEHDCEHETESG